MSPSIDAAQNLRRGIAHELGWTNLQPESGEALPLLGVPPGATDGHLEFVPDWANDLNAASSLPVRDGDVLGVAVRANRIGVTFHPDTTVGLYECYSSVGVSLNEPHAEARARSRAWMDYRRCFWE